MSSAFSQYIEPLEVRALLAGLSFSVGSSGVDYGTGIGTDAAGNVYVAGTFQGKVDFKPGSGTSYLTDDGKGSAFVAKYDKNGAFKWARKIATQTQSFASAPVGVSGRVAVDSAGNVYTTGTFNTSDEISGGDSFVGDAYLIKI